MGLQNQALGGGIEKLENQSCAALHKHAFSQPTTARHGRLMKWGLRPAGATGHCQAYEMLEQRCCGGSWRPHLVKAAMLALRADIVEKAHNPVGG
jgi:hypothetical protein